MKRINKMISFVCLIVCFLSVTALAACGHTHTWENGVCTSCNEKCAHEYNAESVCTICGMACEHRFEESTCKYCGKVSKFKWSALSDGDPLRADCDQPGTVGEVKYQTRAYASESYDPDMGETMIEKTMYVYTPYGYDPSDKTVKYNVLYLYHGVGETEGYWFCQGDYEPVGKYGGTRNFTKNMLDNMIKNKICDPLIVVTPTIFDKHEDKDNYKMDSVFTTAKELQNYIMPLIATNYNTYAASSSKEDLIVARDHVAMAGFSMGSMTTWQSGINESLEYISWFGNYSAGATLQGTDNLDEILNHIIENKDLYPIHYWFHSNGTLDTAHDGHVKDWATLQTVCKDVFTFGEDGDCVFVDMYKGTHTYPYWIVGLYDTLLVFFK